MENLRQMLRASAVQPGNVLLSGALTPSVSGWNPQYGNGVVNAGGALAETSVVQAHILAPAGGSQLLSAVTVMGVAQGGAFDHFRLDAGVGLQPAAWTVLNTGTSPVKGGILGSFDPTLLPDGVYTLRLTAFDSSGGSYTDQVELTINYLAITSPVPPSVPVLAMEYKPGTAIALTGTATGPSFHDFRVQWAEGALPTSGWSTTGITLAGSGAAPVSAGTLGFWDTTAITAADYYTIRLLVDNGTFTSHTDTLVYLEPDLHAGAWPQALAYGYSVLGALAPLSDGSGNTLFGYSLYRSVGPSHQGQILMLKPDGSMAVNTPVTAGDYFKPCVGPLTGSTQQGLFASNGPSDITLFKTDGTSSLVFQATGSPAPAFCNETVVMGDVEGLGQTDIVSLGCAMPALTSYLYAFRQDGSTWSPNFPVAIPDQNTALLYMMPRVLMGDIHGKGDTELIVVTGNSPSTYSLALFAHDGTPLPWPIPIFNYCPGPIALADLDHNGMLETILYDRGASLLHVFQPDGSERTGWPRSYAACSGLAVGDLDGSGHIAIIFSSYGQLNALAADGTPYSKAWPHVPSNMYDTYGDNVYLADIDGDGFPEILVQEYSGSAVPYPWGPPMPIPTPARFLPVPSSAGEMGSEGRIHVHPQAIAATAESSGSLLDPSRLVAFRRDGSVAKSWMLLGINGLPNDINASVAVGDFDGNGQTDILLACSTIGDNVDEGGMATLLTTGSPYVPAANDWPMQNHDGQNSSVYREALTHLTVTMTSPTVGTLVPGPMLLAATAIDDLGVTGVYFQVDGVNVGTTLTQRPYTFTYDGSALAPGIHLVSAVGRSRSGRACASASAPVSINIPKLASSTSLVTATGATSFFPGDTVTLIATVAPATATGSVVFLDGTTALSAGMLLVNGNASFTTSSLSPGPHTLTATYGGDALTAASQAPNLGLAMTTFALTATTPSATVAAGGTATYSLALTGAQGFNGAVTFTCSGLPGGAQGTFSPATLTPGAGSATTTLTVSTAGAVARLGRWAPVSLRGPLGIPCGGGLLGLVWFAGGSRKRTRRPGAKKGLLGALVLLAAMLLARCGGGGGGGSTAPVALTPPAPQTSTITVTATSGLDSQTVQVTLVINS